MTLEAAFFVSQIIAAAAVVASLLFVGFEIRHGTRATRAQINQNIASGWFSVGPLIADSSRLFATGIRADERAFAAMSDEEKLSFGSALFVYFKHYENMYLQHQEGFIRTEDWQAWMTHMFLYWHMPGVQVWWRMRRGVFSPRFRQYIEAAAAATPPAAELLAVYGEAKP